MTFLPLRRQLHSWRRENTACRFSFTRACNKNTQNTPHHHQTRIITIREEKSWRQEKKVLTERFHFVVMRIKWICRVRMWKIFSANILSDGSLSFIELHHRIFVVYTTFYSTARDSFWFESTKVCAPHQHPTVKVKLSSILDEQKEKLFQRGEREKHFKLLFMSLTVLGSHVHGRREGFDNVFHFTLHICCFPNALDTLSLTLLGYNHTLCNVTIIINCCQHSIRTYVTRCWSVGSLEQFLV